MTIVMLRIDDRLVHGQVVEGWLPCLKVDHVVVVSDAVAVDPVQFDLMRMAMPAAVELIVTTVAAAQELLASQRMRESRTLILVPGPAEALALLQNGVVVEKINVGGLHFTVGKVQLGRALFLDEKDKNALRAIAVRGVRLEGQPLPSDSKENLSMALGRS